MSIASAALERSINASLLRRWVIEAERGETRPVVASKTTAVAAGESFVALPLPVQRPADSTPIQIEVRRGAMVLSVQWPRSAMHECAIWLREVSK